MSRRVTTGTCGGSSGAAQGRPFPAETDQRRTMTSGAPERPTPGAGMPHTDLARTSRMSRAPRRTSVRAVATAALAMLLALASPCLAQAPDASAIKADMVCNLAKFVTWPDGLIAQNRGQLVVAIFGEDDLAVTLASVLSTRSVNGKPIFVRFARRAQDCKGAQIVYIASSESAHVDDVLGFLNGAPTITLADTDGFAQRGGMVNFTGAPPRVRFEISLARAEKSGLRISSRLLAIAHVVDGTP